MSGGHWNYLSSRLEEQGAAIHEALSLMAVLEHELDWGICADTCQDCAELRMAPALKAFFDTGATDATGAIALARDEMQHMCPKCQTRAAS
jgi:hypothetical protein